MEGRKPFRFGVLLYPGFEVLDVAGPLECINTLSRMPGWEGLRVYVIGRTACAHHPVTPANPDGPTSAGWAVESAQRYVPQYTLYDAPELDVLIVPGGFGSLPYSKVLPEITFIQTIFPRLQYLFTVCTGAGLAAKAGVLDGLRATTNKAVWKTVAAYGPRTYWVAHARWVVSGENSKVWTTSGVSAGTDGMLAFFGHVYGEAIKLEVYPKMEWIMAKDAEDDPFATYYKCSDIKPVESE